MDLLEGAKQLSILVGIGVALYGIDSWRREHSGKRRLELAEDALALFYEAADAIKHIRHPASFGSELSEIVQNDGETEAAFTARKNASIVFVRYQQHQEAFNKLHAMRYRFMAQIGKDSAKPFDELRSIVTSIQMSASWLARLWPREHFRTDDQWESHRKLVEKYEAVFWDHFEDDDPINLRLSALVSDVERICGAVIKGRGTLFGLLNAKFRRSS